VETTDHPLDLYRADDVIGDVVLGGNMATGAVGAASNYIVIVVPQ